MFKFLNLLAFFLLYIIKTENIWRVIIFKNSNLTYKYLKIQVLLIIHRFYAMYIQVYVFMIKMCVPLLILIC